MSYVDGFVIPVPTGKRDAFLALAQKVAPLFKELGATQVVENWGDDVPVGKLTDFRRSVNAEEAETVVFSWVVWPDKATRDAGNKRMMEDPRMQPSPDMPFDGRRMIFAGFETIVDTGA